ncbi:60S ribosomal protein L13 [Cerrena zonata]|uniref:60S ribosomal protein L13 n=1 Tax=Cerrena zonata TaxID=2478898 RepID=A0AAW0FGP8_9APHY
MAISKNLPLLKNHFRKHWQERVKVHLDQAGKKASRRQHRASKAASIAPRPLDALRPVVRAPTIKYNRKVRAGRGFTLAELKAVGYSAKYARTIGIAVDHRRQNKAQETFDANVARLQEYKSKLVVFDRKTKASEAATFEQVSTPAVFPVVQAQPESAPRAVEVPEQTAFRTLRLAKSDKKYKGIREKRAKEKAEAEADKKKK